MQSILNQKNNVQQKLLIKNKLQIKVNWKKKVWFQQINNLEIQNKTNKQIWKKLKKKNQINLLVFNKLMLKQVCLIKKLFLNNQIKCIQKSVWNKHQK